MKIKRASPALLRSESATLVPRYWSYQPLSIIHHLWVTVLPECSSQSISVAVLMSAPLSHPLCTCPHFMLHLFWVITEPPSCSLSLAHIPFLGSSEFPFWFTQIINAFLLWNFLWQLDPSMMPTLVEHSSLHQCGMSTLFLVSPGFDVVWICPYLCYQRCFIRWLLEAPFFNAKASSILQTMA